jgi:hypothetical protein
MLANAILNKGVGAVTLGVFFLFAAGCGAVSQGSTLGTGGDLLPVTPRAGHVDDTGTYAFASGDVPAMRPVGSSAGFVTLMDVLDQNEDAYALEERPFFDPVTESAVTAAMGRIGFDVVEVSTDNCDPGDGDGEEQQGVNAC